MRVIVALVFDSDATAWAHKRGIAEAETSNDFAALLERAVNAGAITTAVATAITGGLDAVLPVQSGHADITVTAHTIDGLDATTREELLRRLRVARNAEQDQELLAEVRNHLGEHLVERAQQVDDLPPRWVVFATTEWDDGHFLTGSDARVYFDDGQNVPVDFHGSRVDELLTAMYGARGATAALGLDLRDGTLEFDDYADNVPDLLGIPAHRHHTDDGCAIYATDYTVLRNGVDVPIPDLRTGDVFYDHDNTPWRATDVGRDGYDVHVDIEPAANQPAHTGGRQEADTGSATCGTDASQARAGHRSPPTASPSDDAKRQPTREKRTTP